MDRVDDVVVDVVVDRVVVVVVDGDIELLLSSLVDLVILSSRWWLKVSRALIRNGMGNCCHVFIPYVSL
ncbi:hypothetical protein MTR_3g115510 [Medicago truncatula]|uniref:Uncharacterized protein n=1 Tax=Medicago truncatula TaxID=3880 RepID=A0A072V3W0_MEDTR|nr:hypothetical protein MTR_3g115510 [Medicago truncatula]